MQLEPRTTITFGRFDPETVTAASRSVGIALMYTKVAVYVPASVLSLVTVQYRLMLFVASRQLTMDEVFGSSVAELGVVTVAFPAVSAVKLRVAGV